MKKTKAEKSNNFLNFPNFIIGLIIICFGYYVFFYSAKKPGLKVTQTENSSIGLNDSDMIIDRKFSFSLFYLDDEGLKKLNKLSEILTKDFQINGLMIEWHFLNYTLPADIKSGAEMDFKMDSYAGAITNDTTSLTHEVIFKSKECSVRPRLYVLKNSTYKRIEDLSAKKIVLVNIKEIPNVMYDFIAKSKLSGQEYYKNLKQFDVIKGLNLNTFDAILVLDNENRGKRINSARITEEDLVKSFREIVFDYPELPCRGIFASRKLEKRVVDKFINIQSLPREKGIIANLFFSNYERSSDKEMQKIVESFDWNKINEIKQSSKLFTQDLENGIN